jgi:hypothetical protein
MLVAYLSDIVLVFNNTNYYYYYYYHRYPNIFRLFEYTDSISIKVNSANGYIIYSYYTHRLSAPLVENQVTRKRLRRMQ